MAAMGLCNELTGHLGFGCYLLFEVWGSDDGSDAAKFVRILLNANPFSMPFAYQLSMRDKIFDQEAHKFIPEVEAGKAEILAELSFDDIKAKVSELRSVLNDIPVPKGYKEYPPSTNLAVPGSASLDEMD
jgi:hypothetical protein